MSTNDEEIMLGELLDQSDEITPVQSNFPLDGQEMGVKRAIAEALRKAGSKETFISAIGKRMSYREYFAVMLWDIVTNGECLFIDGQKMQITDFQEWLSTAKFLATHLDGPNTNDINVGLNVFKVYMGMDTDKV